jgi:VanZ like family
MELGILEEPVAEYRGLCANRVFALCLFCMSRGRKIAILYATLAGGLLSFAIEVMQAHIPSRGSGTTDIITNTLGAALRTTLARPSLVGMILRRMDTVICSEKPALPPNGKLHHNGGIIFFGIAVVAVVVLLWILRRTEFRMQLKHSVPIA